PEVWRLNCEISPRTRTSANAPSTVRLTACDSSLAVNSGTFSRAVRGSPMGRISFMERLGPYDTSRPPAKDRVRLMRILVVGSGGREHALCWAVGASPLCDKLYCAPGNAGIATEAECVAIAAEDIDGIVRLAREKAIN